MALERDLELLDDYVANRLSADQKSAFEQRLEADPELQRELGLQQKVIETIRQARVAELKSMLNNVPVPAPMGGETSVGSTAVIAVVVTALVGIGIYLVLNMPEKAPVKQPVTTAAPSGDSINQEDVPQQADLNSVKTETTTTQPEEQAVAENKVEKKKAQTTAPKDSATKQRDSVSKSAIDLFDPTEDTVNKVEIVREDEAPLKSAATKSSMSIKTDTKNRKYGFHYQFKNGELYLYGPFNKNLIEIMEFIGENKQAIFLYHENKYYYLNDNKTEKIKPLTAVNDPALLKKLKASRGN